MIYTDNPVLCLPPQSSLASSHYLQIQAAFFLPDCPDPVSMLPVLAQASVPQPRDPETLRNTTLLLASLRFLPVQFLLESPDVDTRYHLRKYHHQ